LEDNYPHSEIWAFLEGNHINAQRDLDREMHLRWRRKLLWKLRVVRRPTV
jgi:hypothetical protein